MHYCEELSNHARVFGGNKKCYFFELIFRHFSSRIVARYWLAFSMIVFQIFSFQFVSLSCNVILCL